MIFFLEYISYNFFKNLYQHNWVKNKDDTVDGVIIQRDLINEINLILITSINYLRQAVVF